MFLSKISKHLRRIDYLDLGMSNNKNVVSDLQLLHLGQLLRGNIARERGPDQIVREESFDFRTFPSNYLSSCSESLLKRKNSLEVFHVTNFQSNCSSSSESPGIALNSCKVLCSTSLVSTKHAFERFYQLQRQRKIWWMKFMYNPGHIAFSNPTRSESAQTISISMKVGEDDFELERIGLYPLVSGSSDSTKTNVLQSWFCLDAAVLSFLIDALPEIVAEEDLTLNLHRRLSPYKLMLLAEREEGDSSDLRDLAQLVNYELTSRGLKVLDGTSGAGEGFELAENISRADQMGVPYSLILGSESLETGVIKLRNRNTTLCELIHITDVPGYIESVIQG